MTLEEAKNLMTPEAKEKLHKLISKPDEIDISKKVGNDIIMSAFCQGVLTGVIQQRSVSDKMVKLLNSDTNTMSDIKLAEILNVIHKQQKDIVCTIYLRNNLNEDLMRWNMYDVVSFEPILGYIINVLGITPQLVRTKLADTLKSTIVNNMSQLVSKFNSLNDDEKKEFRVSIMSITRLVNMCGYIIIAKFCDGYKYEHTTIEEIWNPNDEE